MLFLSVWVANDSYNVFELPKENPNDGSRTLVVDPADPTASSFGWHDTDGVSGAESTYQADYGCQGDTDERQHAKMNVFKKIDGEIFHFWGSEIPTNDIDMVWSYWNLMDLTPAGRPNRPNPPQDFRSRYLEENYSE